MSDLHNISMDSSRATITCSLYVAEAGRARCQFYPGAGICNVRSPALQECSEWRKVNPALPTPAPVEQQAACAPSSRSAGLPLFDPNARTTTGSSAELPAAARAFVPSASDPVALVGLSASDVADWKARRTELCVQSAVGELWIVPEYRDDSRLELSVDHVATVVAIASAFPGARVQEVRRLPASEGLS
jgi:hypothetical protein